MKGPMDRYMYEIDKTPLLRRDEEIALSKRVMDGDAEARDLLIRANLRLVVDVAKRYAYTGIPMADLIGDGNIGLIRAAGDYDYTRGTRFSTYAVWWIRQTIDRSVTNTGRFVRVPCHMRTMLAKYHRVLERWQAKRGSEPTRAQLRHAMRISEQQMKALEAAVKSETAPIQLLEDYTGMQPFDTAAANDESAWVQQHLRLLTPREQQVLRLRFFHNKLLREVAEIIGVTRERVRQLETQALAKLRQWLTAKI